MKHIIFFIIISIFFGSCNFFSKNKEEEKNKSDLEYKLAREIRETKNFNYLSELISYEKNFSKDTIQLVLKEYYKTYEAYIFNENLNRLQDYDNYYRLNIPHKIDFINSIERKHKLNRKTLYLIINEIDNFFKSDNLNDIEDMKYDIEDLNDKFSKD
jgi:hypothetical protein